MTVHNVNAVDQERFWALVNKTDSCWLWTGYTHPTGGHGMFWLHGTMKYAHRVAWELLRGPIPTDMVIDHDHPQFGCQTAACVNPEHLDVTTNDINLRRKRHVRADSQTGLIGVTFDKRRKKWIPYVDCNGKRTRGPAFDDPEDAVKARAELYERLHGEPPPVNTGKLRSSMTVRQRDKSDNEARALRARQALTYYQTLAGVDADADSLSDLLADMRHLAEQIGVTYQEADARAEAYFEYEHDKEG